MPIEPTIAREAAAWDDACLLVGVDEVGRGPLAGPVVAAAVVFPRNFQPIPGVRDSKTLPAAHRNTLAEAIRASALALGVGAASVREIDALNIRVATALAMRRALRRTLSRLDAENRILVDGLPFRELGYVHEALVDGDAHCFSIAAAGIVAKTVRDRVMHRLAARHPGYGWETNVGYGTPEHQQGLQRLGPCVHHRRSFAPVAQLAFL
ncbi:MAG TPA: ribonuclease HII [Gemmatimonadales bacterium]|jgi:ribonuclease HII|nr:ribonuclease HII [Gemmatimonadales bacterium]